MNLNPFQTITIKCPFAVEEAWQRLREVTFVYTEGFLSALLTGLVDKNKKIRYAGKLNPPKFALRRRVTKLFLFQYRWVVLKGEIKSDSDGCTITIRTRPSVLLATNWLGMAVGLILMVAAFIKEDLIFTPPVWLFLVAFVVVLYMMAAQFADGIIREKEFLQSVFKRERLWPERE